MESNTVTNNKRTSRKELDFKEYNIPRDIYDDVNLCSKTKKYTLKCKDIPVEYLSGFFKVYTDFISNLDKQPKSERIEIIVKSETNLSKKRINNKKSKKINNEIEIKDLLN